MSITEDGKRKTEEGPCFPSSVFRLPFILPLVAVLFLAGCSTPGHPEDEWFGRDKAYHFVGGMGIGGVATAIALDSGEGEAESLVLAVGVTFGIGAGKEAFDASVRKTYWSWRDIAWDIAGGLVGGVVVLQADD